MGSGELGASWLCEGNTEIGQGAGEETRNQLGVGRGERDLTRCGGEVGLAGHRDRHKELGKGIGETEIL